MKKLKELIKQRELIDKQITKMYKEVYLKDYSQYVLNVIATHYRISPLDIISNKKNYIITSARKIYCKAMREKGYTYEYIANKINKTHASVMYMSNSLTEEQKIILFNKIIGMKN